jgi:hypothetical protein
MNSHLNAEFVRGRLDGVPVAPRQPDLPPRPRRGRGGSRRHAATAVARLARWLDCEAAERALA